MTATILQFPRRDRLSPGTVHIVWEQQAWLVIYDDHSWLFSTYREAATEACEIAAGFGVPVEVRL